MHMTFPSSRCKVSSPRGEESLRPAAAPRQAKGKNPVGYLRTYFHQESKKEFKGVKDSLRCRLGIWKYEMMKESLGL